MPSYLYTAKTLKGETKTGTLSAKDIHQLAQKLKEEDLVLVKGILEEEKEKNRLKISIPFFKVSSTEKIMMTRNLQVMIASGLSLVRSLTILTTQTKSKKLKIALSDIKEEISEGRSFSEALAKYPDIFSELFLNMVKVGEEGGTLEEVLKTLSLQMEREKELKSEVKGAMIYPLVILTTMLGIGILMMIVVVPKLSSLFNELGVELPLMTKIVIALGTALAEKWYLVILIILFLPIIIWRAVKTKKGKWAMDTFFLKFPIISSIIKKSNSASIIRTLSSLIASGVPIVRSLEVISGTLGNVYFKRALTKAAEGVEKGEKLSNGLKPYKNIFSFGMIEMIEVGEETGETPKILAKLAEFFEEEVSNVTKNLVSVIEPILMLIIGVAVGFFAIAMIQPMYSMLQTL